MSKHETSFAKAARQPLLDPIDWISEMIFGPLMALTALPDRPRFTREELLGAVATFAIVVLATFPVALPFIFIRDPATALHVSRAVAVSMMFLAGVALGRYAGYGSWKAGFLMAGVGTAVVIVVIALGG
jgi:VIT1/CCC1 family predicted Fe2+/Mn2+ transporter